MKMVLAAMVVLGFSVFATDASARPGWGHQCSVSFQKCDFAIGGNCLKWNSKTFQIRRDQARWACYNAERQYGRIRHCYVQCN